MAIKSEITFEGLKYRLDDRDRVAAFTALQGVASGDFDYSNVSTSDPATTGSLFVTASHHITGSSVDAHGYAVLCVSGVQMSGV